jgi:hypothetical protein
MICRGRLTTAADQLIGDGMLTKDGSHNNRNVQARVLQRSKDAPEAAARPGNEKEETMAVTLLHLCRKEATIIFRTADRGHTLSRQTSRNLQGVHAKKQTRLLSMSY